MDNRQPQQQQMVSQTGKPDRRKIRLFVTISLATLAIATLWAVSDVGWMPSSIGKLALVFFSWIVLEAALYPAFFRGKGD